MAASSCAWRRRVTIGCSSAARPTGSESRTVARRPSNLRADRDSDYDGKARRVRGWLARSDAVQRFRQINEALEQQDAVSPEALSLRVTGALLAELLGDPGAAQPR